MANHTIDCDYCGEDMRCSSMNGCETYKQAKKCYKFSQICADKFVEHQKWWWKHFNNKTYIDDENGQSIT